MPKLRNSKIVKAFIEELPADKNLGNNPRQVYDACYSFVEPRKVEKPTLLIVSEEMADELAIDDTGSTSFLHIVSGKEIIPNSKPYAMCYGGHQFGHWAGQLGDGRAINLAQLQGKSDVWTLQLKGAGVTPYSRGADGLAVLRSSIREFLCSEAMFHLGVSTTRALSLSLTGEQVLRDVLYNGNPDYEPGAVVCRTAPSFIRFGSFEILSARKDVSTLKKLADYTIKHHYPQWDHLDGKEKYIAFFNEVAEKTAKMIVDWQRVGFVHGVMNTDNMSILGQTIDFGPYGWLENFDQEWTPNTTDREHRRYRFGNQGSIALWNLTQLANALYPLIEDVSALEKVLDNYRDIYVKSYYKMLNAKLGLHKLFKEDEELHKTLFELLTSTQIDMTMFYRNLVKFDGNKMEESLAEIKKSTYASEVLWKENISKWQAWLLEYKNRLVKEELATELRHEKMLAINPKYVLRNYMAQLAIEDAEKGKYELLHELHLLLKNPYGEQKDMEKWFALRPNWALDKVGCSQLSCSS